VVAEAATEQKQAVEVEAVHLHTFAIGLLQVGYIVYISAVAAVVEQETLTVAVVETVNFPLLQTSTI
jgi:hypothetical protein